MRIKAEIEELQAKLEATRVAELEAEIVDMKKRIIAFGIRPDQLFGPDDLDKRRIANRARKGQKRTQQANGNGAAQSTAQAEAVM